MSEIRLIAMDLDGTLLNDQGTVSEENRKALALAREKGVITAACSGRYVENVSLIFMDNGLSGPIIGSNGAQASDVPLGSMIFRHFIAPDKAARIRETLDEMGTNYFIFADRLIVSNLDGAHHHSEISMGSRILSQTQVRFTHGPAAVDEAIGRGIYKFYICNNGELDDTREILAQIPGTVVTRSTPWNLEMMAEGVDKGTGLSELAAWLHIPMSQVMAFGDQENDLPMLLSAGMGVAMGNAEKQVLARAPYQTLPNTEDGVAAFIRKVIL